MVLLAALRRLTFLVLLGSAVTAVGSLLLGLLFGASALRSLTVGFYLCGAFVMILGFFAGNRGPARVRSETAGPATFPFAFGGRRLRWATASEQHEAINHSAVFVSLGLILVLIGLFIDPQHSLF
jgi:hypothetical protein